jgi:hypothetical protein
MTTTPQTGENPLPKIRHEDRIFLKNFVLLECFLVDLCRGCFKFTQILGNVNEVQTGFKNSKNNFFTKIDPEELSQLLVTFLAFLFSLCQTARPLCKAFIVSPFGTDSYSPYVRVSAKGAQQRP